MADKPAILQDSRFIVEEGVAYRACRIGAIWMNKLFFSSLVLLVVWLLYGGLGGQSGCATVPTQVAGPNGTMVDQGTHSSCNIFLTQTSTFLAAMAAISFLLSIAFGVLGLIVGKRILEMTPAADELGSGGTGVPHSTAPVDPKSPPKP